MSIRIADFGDDAERFRAEFASMGSVDVGPGEVGHEEAGDAGAFGGDQRHRRRVAENGARPFGSQAIGLVVDPGHRLAMDPAGEFQGRRAVGRRAVADRVDRAGVGHMRFNRAGRVKRSRQ